MFSSQIKKAAESDSEFSPSMPEIVFYTSLRDARESAETSSADKDGEEEQICYISWCKMLLYSNDG